MKLCHRGQSSPLCSIRRQLPGRRTGFCPGDRPRVRERAGGVADCHASLREHNAVDAAGRVNRSVVYHVSDDLKPVCRWPISQLRCVGELRPRGRWLPSTNLVEMQLRYCFWYCDWFAIAGDCFFPQRILTVRRVTHLGNCEQKTNTVRFFPLRIHRFFKQCVPVGDSQLAAVEIKCIVTGKSVHLL